MRYVLAVILVVLTLGCVNENGAVPEPENSSHLFVLLGPGGAECRNNPASAVAFLEEGEMHMYCKWGCVSWREGELEQEHILKIALATTCGCDYPIIEEHIVSPCSE